MLKAFFNYLGLLLAIFGSIASILAYYYVFTAIQGIE